MSLTPPDPVLHLHDSARRAKVAFEPLDPSHVTMYVCGPTVYDRAHIGNGRSAVVFDVLVRLLRHLFPRVTYVRNVTDVDDKINARAKETGREIRDITEETLRWYHEDMDALGVARPDVEPRATEYIPQMVEMIGALVAKGHAYAAEGHVLFSVRSDGRYGELSGRSLDDMIAGARVEVAPYKRDPMDFVLWKPSAGDEPGWDSPWGRGRPGWHIECSAMSAELLGETFDIHGGGSDLLFPHHENELAQSSCAHPGAGFARHWVHNAMLRVDGQKMSKSLGNFFTVRDMLDRGVPGEVLRLTLLSTRYSQELDWTEERVRESFRRLELWRALILGAKASGKPDEGVVAALSDDLNTAMAVTRLDEIANSGNGALLKSSAALMGLLMDELGDWFDLSTAEFDGNRDIDQVLFVRSVLRKERRYDEADMLRDELNNLGVAVFDQKHVSRGVFHRGYLGRKRFDTALKMYEAGNDEVFRWVDESDHLGVQIGLGPEGVGPYRVVYGQSSVRDDPDVIVRQKINELRRKADELLTNVPT